MGKLQEFRTAARQNGYAETNEYQAGSIVWLKKPKPHAGTDLHERLCIDSVTDSATVFWQSAPRKLNSKTFRSVASLTDWFGATAG
jgi:hypothetical protein